MTHKLTFRIPSKSTDTTHTRHFFEALEKSADAVIIPVTDQVTEVDFSFITSADYGPARRILYLFRCDPHGMPIDIPIDQIRTRARRDLVTLLGADEIKLLQQMNPNSALPVLDSPQLITCPWLITPFDQLQTKFKNGGTLLYVPGSAPEWIFNTDFREVRFIDVFMFGTMSSKYYPTRTTVLKKMREHCMHNDIIPRSNLHFYQGQLIETKNFSQETANTFDAHQRWYADCLRHAKIFPTCSSIFDVPLSKHWESMACGALVMTTLPTDAEILGFIDGQTVVEIDEFNFMDKIFYYLEHEDERLRIARNAYQLAQANYTCGASVRILLRKLQALLDGAPINTLNTGYEPFEQNT